MIVERTKWKEQEELKKMHKVLKLGVRSKVRKRQNKKKAGKKATKYKKKKIIGINKL